MLSNIDVSRPSCVRDALGSLRLSNKCLVSRLQLDQLPTRLLGHSTRTVLAPQRTYCVVLVTEVEMPSTSSIRVVRIVVAACLIGLAFYTGTVASPYVDTGLNGFYDNKIVNEAADSDSLEVPDEVYLGTGAMHNPQVEENGSVVVEEVNVYQYSELSPTAREIFDDTRTADTGIYSLTLCREWVLVCDGIPRSSVPDEFTYGAVGHNFGQTPLTIIQTEEQTYLLRTGAAWHGDGWDITGLFAVAFSRGTLLLIGSVMLYYAIRPTAARKDGVGTYDIGFGMLIGGLAAGAPYLHMAGVSDVSSVRLLLLLSSIPALLFILYQRYHSYVSADVEQINDI